MFKLNFEEFSKILLSFDILGQENKTKTLAISSDVFRVAEMEAKRKGNNPNNKYNGVEVVEIEK